MIPLWWLTKDGDRDGLAMYKRHYSYKPYKDGRITKLFVGPGEKVVLRTWNGDAYFVWRQYIEDGGQSGVECSMFRNESPFQSSELVRQADRIADCLWPDLRHYTKVDAASVRSRNPGYCFLCAGWRRWGYTGSGKLVLERM